MPSDSRSSVNLDPEQFADHYPELKPLARGLLWKVRHEHPALYKLMQLIWFIAAFSASYVFVFQVVVPVYVSWLDIPIEQDSVITWAPFAAICGFVTLGVLGSMKHFYRAALNRALKRRARQIPLSDRLVVAKAHVAKAYGLNRADLYDATALDKAIQVGVQKEQATQRLVEALESYQKSVFKTSEELVSDNEDDVLQALQIIVGDDRRSLLSKLKSLQEAVSQMPSDVDAAIVAGQRESANRRRKQELADLAASVSRIKATGNES
jgi:hypothetical protein